MDRRFCLVSAVVALSAWPQIALAQESISDEQQSLPADQAAISDSASTDDAEGVVVKPDGDLTLMLKLSGVQVTIEELEVGLQLQELPELRRIISQMLESGGDESESSSDDDGR